MKNILEIKNVLEVKDLRKNFGGVKALDDLSLTIESGKTVGLVGPNGSGKTTLINILSGFDTKDSGQIIVSGYEIDKVAPWENPLYGITRSFQQIRLFDQMTVEDNLLVMFTERNLFSSIWERHSRLHLVRAHEILKRVGLYEKKGTRPADLSYGQRKLLEIARVMAMDAKIILLDEPFAGLFPEMVKEIARFIKEWQHEGRTVVLVEHNMALIRELCQHLIVLDAGKLLAEGSPEEVLGRKDVIEAYLGE